MVYNVAGQGQTSSCKDRQKEIDNNREMQGVRKILQPDAQKRIWNLRLGLLPSTAPGASGSNGALLSTTFYSCADSAWQADAITTRDAGFHA